MLFVYMLIVLSFLLSYSVFLYFVYDFNNNNNNNYRQDAAKWQTAGIKFTHSPKIRVFFALQGRLVTLIRVKLATTDGHPSPLGCVKFHLNWRRGVGIRPQNIEKNNSTFW